MALLGARGAILILLLVALSAPIGASAQSGWQTSASAAAFGFYTREGTLRGAQGAAGSGWLMLGAAHDVAGGTWSADAMLMLDPLLRPTCGYPRILSGGPPCRFARGEDRAPVHALISGLGTRYARGVGPLRMGLSAALAGDPALGADPWFHRPRAATNPVVPLTQHEITPAHGIHGVLGASVAAGAVSLEGSLFNGSAPDTDPYDLDLGGLDAWSARLRWQAAPGLRLWGGVGAFPAAGGHHGGDSEMSVRTVGLDVSRSFAGVDLFVTAAGARHTMDGHADDAMLVEVAGEAGRHMGSLSWERAERAEETIEIIHLPDGGHDHNLLRFPYTVSELAGSYGVELVQLKGAKAALGARYARTFLPALLEGRYQTRSGNSFTAWISLRGQWASPGGTAAPEHVH
jgi:hypothetical protein